MQRVRSKIERENFMNVRKHKDLVAFMQATHALRDNPHTSSKHTEIIISIERENFIKKEKGYIKGIRNPAKEKEKEKKSSNSGEHSNLFVYP